MPDHEFLFALEVSDEPHFHDMLTALTGTVLAHVGYPEGAAGDLREKLRAALQAGLSNGHRRCDVRFVAESGELRITVAYAGGAEWRTARALP